MNKRILELAELATLYTSDVCYPDDPDWHETRDQRFAELIVRECANVEQYWLSEQNRKAVAENIKQHFGVEE
jgi:hypothetical protein